MNSAENTEDKIEEYRNGAVAAYSSGTINLVRLAEILGVDTPSARCILQERGIQLHEKDNIEADVQITSTSDESEQLSAGKTFALREWTIQSFRIDRWIDDTSQDRPYTFDEMKDALARCELLHFDVRHRGYNHVRKKCYEPM